jgi:AcrR family transcriptional regulator
LDYRTVVRLGARITQVDQSPDTVKTQCQPGLSAGLPLLEPNQHERADAARNRAAILCAAERLVAQQGADRFTMDEVACAAGVGKGTLFRRFGDRAGLLRALLDERERSFQEDFIRGAPPLGPGAPAHERLIAFGHRLLEEIEIQGDLLLAAETGAPGERLLHSVYAAHRAHMAALLGDVAPAGDADYIADVLLGMLGAEVVLYQRRVLGMSLERLRAGWLELLDGLLR